MLSARNRFSARDGFEKRIFLSGRSPSSGQKRKVAESSPLQHLVSGLALTSEILKPLTSRLRIVFAQNASRETSP